VVSRDAPLDGDAVPWIDHLGVYNRPRGASLPGTGSHPESSWTVESNGVKV